MQVSLKYAEEHLADLVSAAYRGEEVEIAAPDQPSVRLTLVTTDTSANHPQSLPGSGKGDIWFADDWDSDETNGAIWATPERPRAELFGSLAGKTELADDWDSPETNEEIADLFENSEIFPDAPHP